MLAERNNVIAKNILTECIRLSLTAKGSGGRVEDGGDDDDDDERRRSGRNKTIVAVLGMAHCNGVKKILTQKL